MTLYAWIGEDELGSGVVGLKQALVPAGYIPLVSLDRAKLDTPSIRAQLQQQASQFGKTIRLVAFELTPGELVTLAPGASAQDAADRWTRRHQP
jgi:hypothetical protein